MSVMSWEPAHVSQFLFSMTCGFLYSALYPHLLFLSGHYRHFFEFIIPVLHTASFFLVLLAAIGWVEENNEVLRICFSFSLILKPVLLAVDDCFLNPNDCNFYMHMNYHLDQDLKIHNRFYFLFYLGLRTLFSILF